jgi:hypothetical protein
MQRVALAMTFVGLIAACIPPGQNGSSQSAGTWSSQPAYQNQPDQNQPDQSQPDPDQNQPDQPYSTPIRDNSRRPAAGSYSHSGDNCAPVCERFDQCRLWRYDSCMGYCSSNTNDPAKNLSAARWSCSQLGAWMQQLGVARGTTRATPRNSGNSGGVTCTAEASLGTTQGNMPTIYRTITAMGNGPSRDAASVQALKDCGALVGTAQNLAWLSGEQTEGGNCVISRCTQ